MNHVPSVVLPGLIALGGIVAGVLGSMWWARRAARARRRIPKHWPLHPRSMVNSEECRVWRWLIRVFFDHCVMLKVPVTRFTFPRANENSARWYQLLSGVYCTFTICGPDGHVVGCVDVPGRNGISRSNRQLKLTLLSQCGIAYWVVKPSSLPTLQEIRTEFLGERAAMPGATGGSGVAVTTAHQKLRDAVERQRHKRLAAGSLVSAGGPNSEGSPESVLPESDFAPSAWQQANSFVAPLDSRPGKLR
jgi:hypothetical protein